jgi:hypothetical protein
LSGLNRSVVGWLKGGGQKSITRSMTMGWVKELRVAAWLSMGWGGEVK